MCLPVLCFGQEAKPTASSSSTVRPLTGPSAFTIPGVIQAEWFIWQNGVQTQPTTDSAGGNNVGWIDNQDWMNYQFYVTDSGKYMAGFRVATPYNNASFEIWDDQGNVIANVKVPNTGGLQQTGNMADAAFIANTGVWPNPVHDLLTIQLNDTLSGKMVVQLVDQAGAVRQVTELVKTPGVSQFTINTGGLSSGVYFVRIIVGNQVQVRKVLRL